MYKIVDSEFSDMHHDIVDIIADTTADVPNVADNWAVGSTVWIVNESRCKILNCAREWVDV